MCHHEIRKSRSSWGAFRIAFLQYASDPITFFSPQSAWREPDWLKAPRGPDVSPDLHWFPLVTMLQLVADAGIYLAAWLMQRDAKAYLIFALLALSIAGLARQHQLQRTPAAFRVGRFIAFLLPL